MTAPLISALAVSLVVAFAVGVVTNGVWARRIQGGSSFAWTAITLAPLGAGLFTLLALLTPHPFRAGCHCSTHIGHHPHLCWLHPTFAEPLLIPGAVCVGIWLAVTVKGLLHELVQLAHTSRRARHLNALPVIDVDGVPVRLADCGDKVAFTVGLARPQIVVDRALFDALTHRERRALVHHEAGHVERRDPLTFAILRFATRALSPLGGEALIHRWRLAAEMECDQRAAAKLGSATEVASALVKVARFRVDESNREPSFALGMTGSDLRRRVVSLLEGPTKAPGTVNDVAALGVATIGLALLVVFWPGDMVHHAVETVLGIAIH